MSEASKELLAQRGGFLVQERGTIQVKVGVSV